MYYYIVYFFSKAVKGIKEHLFLHIITVSLITFSMVIFGAFSLIFMNLKLIINDWESRVHISAYLEDGLTQTEVKELKSEISKIEGIKKVDYVSKEEAYRIFKKDLKGLGGVLDGLQQNPLPASFEIRVKEDMTERDDLDRIVEALQNFKHIEDTDYGGQWFTKLSAFFFIFKLILLVLSIFLFLTITMIVSNAVRLTLFARRDEIEVMRLIGATDTFIKFPFVIEGFLQGFVGSGLAWMIVSVLYLIISPRLKLAFNFILGFSSILPFTYVMLIGMFMMGSGLGVLGSFVSMKRFLK